MTTSRRQGWLALAIYGLAAAVLLVLPTRLHLHNTIIGSPGFLFLWMYSWWPWAIIHGFNPLYTQQIWVPGGQNLLWVTSIPSVSIVMAPVTLLWGPLASYNLVVVLAPALGAWSAYLLGREMTGKFMPALFGGWVFGFSGYEFGHLLGEVNMFVTFAIPLLVWIYMLHWKGKIGRRWYILLATVLLVFQFGVSTEVFATLLLFGLLAIVAAMAFAPTGDQRRRHLAALGTTVAAILLATVLLAPCWYYVFLVHYVHGFILSPRVIVADPFNYVIPTNINWLGHLAQSWIGPAHWLARWQGRSYEQDAYLGLPLLGIVLLFLREFIHQKSIHVLIFMLAVVFVASLGPRLHVPVHIPAIPLPWQALVHLPLLDKALPARFSLYVSLAVAMIGAWWMACSQQGRWAKVAWAAATIVFMMPCTWTHSWRYRVPNPGFFTSPALDRYIPQGTTVLIFPDGFKGRAMYWQAESNFRFAMAGGYIGTQVPRGYATSAAQGALANGPDYANQRAIEEFLIHHHVGAVIVPAADWPAATAPYAFLHTQPIISGRVRLYLLRRAKPDAVP